MKTQPDPHPVTLAQWLAVLAVWAMALYGLVGAPKASSDVRFAQATPDAACRDLR